MNQDDRAPDAGSVLAVGAIDEPGPISGREALDRGQPGEIGPLERVAPAERGELTRPTERDRRGEPTGDEKDQGSNTEPEPLPEQPGVRHRRATRAFRDRVPRPELTLFRDTTMLAT
jgi:hypothetical protein